MKTLKQTVAVLAVIILFFSCQKEMSFETDTNQAIVTLTSCDSSIEVKGQGRYVKDSTLDGSVNYVEVTVQVQTPGLYNVSTNQNNGFYFADSGFLVNTIPTVLKLRAVGTPVASVLTHFDLTFNGMEACSFEVLVTDSVVYYAEYTLKDSTGVNCIKDSVEGIYEGGVPLNSTNLLTVDVNVTFPGLFTLQAGPTNGMTFVASGNFPTTGMYTVTLTGTGTPIAADTTGPTVMVLEGDNDLAPNCTFFVSVDSIDYFPTTTNSTWTYAQAFTPDTSVVKVLATDKTINTVDYRQFRSVNSNVAVGTDTFYYRKGGHEYYEYGNNAPPQGLDFIYDTVYGFADYPFLKDNISVGGTWVSPELTATTVIGDSGVARISFSIVAKNISVMVNTTMQDSIIQVKRVYEFKKVGTSSFVSKGSGDFYYRRNKGLLRFDITPPSPNPVVTVFAKSWQIF